MPANYRVGEWLQSHVPFAFAVDTDHNDQPAEVAPSNRAGCQDTVCKAEKVKIKKGELRLGTWIEIVEHGSWRWKHWYETASSRLLPFPLVMQKNICF